MRSHLIGSLVLGGVLAALMPAPAGADAGLQPTAIRAAGAIGVDFIGLGIEASRPLGRWFGVDGMLAGGGVSDSFGLTAEVLGRVGYFGSRHALSFGLGPSVMHANSYGNVAFAQSELTYEYCAPRGISLLVGWGPTLALSTSESNSCLKPAVNFSPGCGFFYREQFQPGQLGMRWRAGVGVAF